MKHLQSFSGFLSESEEFTSDSSNSTPSESEKYFSVLNRLIEISGDEWFINGDNAPDDIITELEDEDVNNEELCELIEFTAGGPGFTDVWLENMELISDAVREGYSEEDIYEDNQRYFAEKRKELIDKIANKIELDEILLQEMTEHIRNEGSTKIVNALKNGFPNLWAKIKPLLGFGSNEIENLTDLGF